MGGSQHELRLVRPYDTPDGPAGEFVDDEGQAVRLEPRSDAVVVGWTVRDGLPTLAEWLAASQLEPVTVHAIVAGKVFTSEVPDGADAAAIVRSRSEADLVRVEGEHETVVWEQEDDDVAELSVVAPTWSDARGIVRGLGAKALGEVLPTLVAAIPQTA